ncbi:hypothetical protein LSH36_556g00004, partial [Paralvinella palmiformis]
MVEYCKCSIAFHITCTTANQRDDRTRSLLLKDFFISLTTDGTLC